MVPNSVKMDFEGTSRTLEITVLSCEDLRIDGRYVKKKKKTYVIVRTDPLNYRTTNMDTGGSYPSWNQKLVIDMPLRERFVTVEVRCKTASGDRILGSSRMPATDFMGGYLPPNYLNFLSYRLRDGRGERNGVVNLSVKVKMPEYLSTRPDKACSSSSTTPALAVPVDGFKNLGVVTGVPVWGANGAQCFL